MGRMKEYMMELADNLNKDFEEITQEDMERDFKLKAQQVWNDPNTSWKEKQDCKQYLPKKSYDEVKFYDAETGTPKFKPGNVMGDGNGICWLITN